MSAGRQSSEMDGFPAEEPRKTGTGSSVKASDRFSSSSSTERMACCEVIQVTLRGKAFLMLSFSLSSCFLERDQIGTLDVVRKQQANLKS